MTEDFARAAAKLSSQAAFQESCGGSSQVDDEALLLQDGSICGAQFDLPVACSFRADGVAAERPIAAAWSCCYAKADDLVHALAAVPAMFDGGVRAGQQSRVEEERSRLQINVCRRALPVWCPPSGERRAQLSVQHGHRLRRRDSGERSLTFDA